MSESSRENLQEANRHLRRAEENLTSAGDLAGADKGLQKRIQTVKEAVSKESKELQRKLNPEKG